MSIEAKYTVANNSVHAKEPKQATSGSAGYDLFATKLVTLLPQDVTPIPLELRMEIPDGYIEKICPRSGLLTRNFVSCDGGIIDSDYRGLVLVLITNHGKEPYIVKTGERIAQFFLHKKEKISFKQVCCLESIERRNNGFGSTGM